MRGVPKKVWVVVGAVAALLVWVALNNDGGAGASTGSGGCRFTVTADVLNVRAGPSTQNKIVDQLAHGTRTNARKTVRHGFRQLGDHRWVAQRFLKPAGGTCATV